jgi:hypothetical protein
MMRASLTRITLLEYPYYHYWRHKDKKRYYLVILANARET